MSNLLAGLEGVAYVAARGGQSHVNVNRTKKMIQRALAVQQQRLGFSFVEILTMCPTGWFIETNRSPGLPDRQDAAVHAMGVLQGCVGLLTCQG